MLIGANTNSSRQVDRGIQTVALVGRYAHRLIEEDVLPDCDVVLLESIAHAYSKIKRSQPDVVILCGSADDEYGCQVLSMLALDRETSHIPVLTYLLSDADFDHVDAGFGASAAAGVSPVLH